MRTISVPQFSLSYNRACILEYLRIVPKLPLLTILQNKYHEELPRLTTPKNV